MASASSIHILVFTVILNFCHTFSPLKSPYYRLPSAIFPTKYNLHISTLIHRDILPFNGSVSIDLRINEAANEIVLNSKQLQLLKIVLINVESGMLLESPRLQYEVDEAKEQLRITWPDVPLKLKIGQQYKLNIDFAGNILENDGFGFFKATYLGDDGSSVPVAATQLEPQNARLVFPCFDEFAFKAKFSISVTHGANYSAVSNMPAVGDPVLSSTPNGEMATTTFLETHSMSTYLVAFAVTNYNNTTFSANGLEHRFFFPPNSDNNGSRALENAVKTVGVLENLLGIKYNLPKLDQIQFGKLTGSAMENWGLMTFQETAILDQKDHTKLELLFAILVLGHEIVHQWFGNLVTPSSLDYIWLKEGMSIYFSHVAANLVYPEDRVLDYFLVSEIPLIYQSSIEGPLTKVVKEGADAQSNYDIVSYQFGGGFFRMFHHAIGHETFMKGISNYLSLFQYSNANEDDFFAAMQAAVDEDKVELFQGDQSVANVMRTWTHNIGFPIVSIVRNYENGTVTIRQRSNSKNKDQKWWIPMSFATAAQPDFERTVADYIMPPQAEVTLDLKDLKDLNINLSSSDWLIVNKQQSGIFCVIYDDLNLKMIAKALTEDMSKIHVLNRGLIFRDLSVIFDDGIDSIEPLLELIRYLKLEEDSLPWFNAVDLILKLVSNLEESRISSIFNNFIYDLSVDMFYKKYQSSSANQLTAMDLRIKSKIFQLKFEVDTVTCQNYTQELAKRNVAGETIETDLPCKLSLCQHFQHISMLEFGTYLRQIVIRNLQSAKFNEFQTILKCIESKEIFELVYYFKANMSVTDFGMFDHLFIFNPFFETWFWNKFNKNTFRGGDDGDAREFVLYRNKKITRRMTFLIKHESNIHSWLVNHEKNHGKSNQIE